MCAPSTRQSAVSNARAPARRNPRTAPRIRCRARRSTRRPACRRRPESARDPEHARHHLPADDALEIAIVAGSCPRSAHNMNDRAHDLDEYIGAGEQQRLVIEGVGNRRRQQQAREHQHEHQHRTGGLVGIDPVGEPAGVHPHPPHGEQQEQRLQRAGQCQVLEPAYATAGSPRTRTPGRRTARRR